MPVAAPPIPPGPRNGGATRAGQRAPLRAAAVLGGSSVIAIGLGLVQAKALAVLVGPEGVGQLALLQSLVTLASTAGGVGLATGIVRVIGGTAVAGEHARARAVVRAGLRVAGVAAALAAAALVLFARPIARAMLGPRAATTDVRWAALAVAATITAAVYTGALNAYQRVTKLALASVLTTAAATAATVAVVAARGASGVVPAVLLTALSALGVAYALAPTEVRGAAPDQQGGAAGGALLRFGIPFTASQLMGAGVQLVLPAVVLHQLGREAVGQYRAASAISTAYMALLVAAFQKDYYPRVAAARSDPVRLRGLLAEQQHLVLLLATPMCIGFLAVAPLLVPVVYSPRFAPAVDVIRWLAVGELLKFAAFSGAHVVLARSSSRVYFAMEAVAGAVLLSASWVGMRVLGLPGLGVAYLLTYAVYFVTCALVVEREIGGATSPGVGGVRLALGLAAALVVATDPWTLPRAFQLPAGLVIAGLATAESVRALLGGERLRAYAAATRALAGGGRG